MGTGSWNQAYEVALHRYLAVPSAVSLRDSLRQARAAIASGVSPAALAMTTFSVLQKALPAAGESEEDQRTKIGLACGVLMDTLSIDHVEQAPIKEDTVPSVLLQMSEAMAHEFRTPLSSILMAAGALEEELPQDLPETTRRLVGHIIAGARDLKATTDDLQAMVEFQSGRASVNRVTLDPALLLRDVLASLAPAVEGAGLEYQVEVPASLPLISADPRRIEQLVRNLVINAAKFSPSGQTVTVAVSASREGLIIGVRDHGRGIPQADREKIFRPFYRSQAHRRVSGLGIGLSLARDIAHAHEGTVSVMSEDGQGALFSVLIPWASSVGLDGIAGTA